jgi:hypothetical protein
VDLLSFLSAGGGGPLPVPRTRRAWSRSEWLPLVGSCKSALASRKHTLKETPDVTASCGLRVSTRVASQQWHTTVAVDSTVSVARKSKFDPPLSYSPSIWHMRVSGGQSSGTFHCLFNFPAARSPSPSPKVARLFVCEALQLLPILALGVFQATLPNLMQ